VPQGELAGPSPIVYGPPPGEAHAPSSARVIPLEAAEPQAPPTEEVALVAEPAGTSVEPVTESAAIEEAVPRPLPLQMPPEEPASIVPEPDPAIDVQAPAATKAAFLEPSPALATRKPAIGKDVQQRTVTEPVRTSAAEPAARQPAASGLQDEVWLLAQDPGHYTVQLTGTHDRQAALSFIRNHALKDKAAWFRTRYKDRDWYVVVTGAYSKREKAQAAIRTLPAGLKRQGPWPRTFASIQASVAGSRSP